MVLLGIGDGRNLRGNPMVQGDVYQICVKSPTYIRNKKDYELISMNNIL